MVVMKMNKKRGKIQISWEATYWPKCCWGLRNGRSFSHDEKLPDFVGHWIKNGVTS